MLLEGKININRILDGWTLTRDGRTWRPVEYSLNFSVRTAASARLWTCSRQKEMTLWPPSRRYVCGWNPVLKMKSGEIESQIMPKYSYLLTNILLQSSQRARGALNFHLPVPSLPARIEIFNNDLRNKNFDKCYRKSCGSEILRIYICLSYYTFCVFFSVLTLRGIRQKKTAEELTTPENTITYHNALCLTPQNLHKHCFQFLLGPF